LVLVCFDVIPKESESPPQAYTFNAVERAIALTDPSDQKSDYCFDSFDLAGW
jgi:hypothetical protein